MTKDAITRKWATRTRNALRGNPACIKQDFLSCPMILVSYRKYRTYAQTAEIAHACISNCYNVAIFVLQITSTDGGYYVGLIQKFSLKRILFKKRCQKSESVL